NTNFPINKEIYQNNQGKTGNEFLFFLKPEVFFYTSAAQIQQALKMVFERFTSFGIHINNIRLFNANFLERNNLIAQHYGVINAVAQNAKKNFTDEAVKNFSKIYNEDFHSSKVFGSLELLINNPDIDQEKLATLWKSAKIERLTGGIYSVKAIYNNEPIYIINGFHPPQIAHFTDEGRYILAMSLSGNIDWKEARQKMIGNTYPEKAEKGTIRRDLSDLFGNYGFENVSYVINSAHLSAGPLEGLIELMRFNLSNTPWKYLFGQLLAENFTQNLIDLILTNPVVKFKQTEASLFDLTEELNAAKAIQLLKQIDWESK
ncbi:MAG: hypothetical protein HC831_21320, partial [Chloroflexia bacterium]|nr:hypothetical protein [Chloroflexia bacterium]